MESIYDPTLCAALVVEMRRDWMPAMPHILCFKRIAEQLEAACAEVERLRKEDAAWSDLCNQQTELLEAKLKLGQTHACGWCVMAAGDTEEARNAVEKMTLDAVRAHALICAHNPLVAERDALRADTERMRAVFAKAVQLRRWPGAPSAVAELERAVDDALAERKEKP